MNRIDRIRQPSLRLGKGAVVLCIGSILYIGSNLFIQVKKSWLLLVAAAALCLCCFSGLA